MVILISIIFALFASLLSSMLGGGFGLISVPTVYWIISHYYPLFPYKMQMTIATGSTASITLGVIASYKHAKYKNIDFSLYKKVLAYMIIGVILGALAMTIVHSDNLKKIFAIIVLLTAIWMAIFNIEKSKKFKLNKWLFKTISGYLGFISTFIGLSIFNVPFFILCGIDIKKSIGTSTILVFTYSTVAALWLIILGIPKLGVSYNNIGYLNLPIFLSTVIPCIIGSIIGAKLVNLLPKHILKRIFVAMMFLVGIIMLF